VDKDLEKRKNLRVDCLVPIDAKEGSYFDETKTVDISRGGIGFVSANEIPLNQEIAVEIDFLEEEAPVFVIGKVCWVHPISNSEQFRIGMNFDNILSGSKRLLYKYLSP